MKKTLLSIFTIVACYQSFAQSPAADSAHRVMHAYRRHEGHAPIYINLGTGINNNGGLVGVGLEVPVARQFSVEGGLGLSTWGSKLYVCAKYYLQPNFKGWAFGPGVSHNTGLDKFTMTAETIYGDQETVELNLAAQTNLFLAAYRSWRLGKWDNRVALELGWSVPLNTLNITQTGGNPIGSSSLDVVKILSPGGLIVAFNFSFGAGGKHKETMAHYNSNQN